MIAAAVGLVFAQVVAPAASQGNDALLLEAETAFDRGEAGRARIVVDTVYEREGVRGPGTAYWRRLLAVSGCAKSGPVTRGSLAMRLLDLEEARGRRFRGGESPVGTVWETWLAEGGLKWRNGGDLGSTRIWRHEKEIWPDERHVADGVRSRCRGDLSDATDSGAAVRDEVALAQELLGGAIEAVLRERVRQLLVSRLLAMDRQAEAKKWIRETASDNAEIRLARLALGVAKLNRADLDLLTRVARAPTHGASVAAQARLLATLAEARRWNDVSSLISTTPDVEPLHSYRDYLSIVALDRGARGDADAAVFARVKELRARRRSLGSYRAAVEAILVRRTALRVAGAPSVGDGSVRAWLSPLLESVAPHRQAEVVDAVHQSLVSQRNVRPACVVVSFLRNHSPTLAARREIECAVLGGAALRFGTLVAALVDEEPARTVREVFGALPALIAAAPENGQRLGAALLAVVDAIIRDADDSERIHWESVAATLRGIAVAKSANTVALGRVVVDRAMPPLLPPPMLRFGIPEPEHFLWHRLYPTRAKTTLSESSPTDGKSGAGTVSIGRTSSERAVKPAAD